MNHQHLFHFVHQVGIGAKRGDCGEQRGDEHEQRDGNQRGKSDSFLQVWIRYFPTFFGVCYLALYIWYLNGHLPYLCINL